MFPDNKFGGWIAVAALLAAVVPGYDCVQILSMVVPEAVEAGSEDIILDCDFTYTEEEKSQIDVKWFFNNEEEPIYQWIMDNPKQPGGQLISDLFRGHIIEEFEDNDEDSFKKHRALHIKNPLPKFSGTYKCQVSSFGDYDTDQKNLLIYAPPSSIKFSEMLASDSEPLNVTCIASGMYPEPNASLTWGHNSSESEQVETEPDVTHREDGLVDVVLSTSIAHNELDVITVIGCQISLPGTQFSIQEQTVFYPLGLEPTSASTVEEVTIPEVANATVEQVWEEEDNHTEAVRECEGSGDCECEGGEGSGGAECAQHVEEFSLMAEVDEKKDDDDEEEEEENRPRSGASRAGLGSALASLFVTAVLSSSIQHYLNRN